MGFWCPKCPLEFQGNTENTVCARSKGQWLRKKSGENETFVKVGLSSLEWHKLEIIVRQQATLLHHGTMWVYVDGEPSVFQQDRANVAEEYIFNHNGDINALSFHVEADSATKASSKSEARRTGISFDDIEYGIYESKNHFYSDIQLMKNIIMGSRHSRLSVHHLKEKIQLDPLQRQ
jgi:hypothetical protein